VGSWQALTNHFPSDAAGNVRIGASEALEARDNIVFSRERLTALIGVENLVVVQAQNATLVCAKDRVQDVKKLVKLLAANRAYREVL
jgi:mannose-1-phosphate guanylyltransferase